MTKEQIETWQNNLPSHLDSWRLPRFYMTTPPTKDKDERYNLYTSLVHHFLDAVDILVKKHGIDDYATIFAAMIQVAWMNGHSAMIKDGLSMDKLEQIEYESKAAVRKTFKDFTERIRTDGGN